MLQSNQHMSLPMAQSIHMQPVKTEHQKRIVQSNYMSSVKAELKKSQVNNMSQLQTSQ